MKEQARNRSTNVIIEFRGKRATIAEWSEIIGLKFDTLWMRLQCKWTIKKSLTYNTNYNV